MSNSIALYAGDGRGGFASPVDLAVGRQWVRELRAGDVDRDGDADIVFLGDTQMHVVRSTSTGTLDSAYALEGFASWFELADLNRDGSLDVLVAHNTQLTAFDGDGAGGFSPRVAANREVFQFALGDLNHDGWLDLATNDATLDRLRDRRDARSAGRHVRRDRGIPDRPSHSIPSPASLSGTSPATATWTRSAWSGTILTGNGDGSFGGPAAFAFESRGIIALDWNRDGLLDLVAGGQALLNERRDVNRPPVANAGPDATYTYRDHLSASVYAGAVLRSRPAPAHLRLA